MPARDHDLPKNRDDEMKPGAPPRRAYEPNGAEGSTQNAKTMTDPATGAPLPGAPAPAAADSGDGEGDDDA